MKERLIPTGDLQGDSRGMKDCGTGVGVSDTYGADISGGATNRQGGMGNAAKSDTWAESPTEHEDI
jgi:hypothetical protein